MTRGVIAGFASEMEAVNQQPAVTKLVTAIGIAAGLCRIPLQITANTAKLATNSATSGATRR